MTTAILSVSDIDARIVAIGSVPQLADWQRAMLIRLSKGPISDACRDRIEGVLVADETDWCES